jgi:hypothetical protein
LGYLVGEGAVWEDLDFVIGGQRHVQGGPGGRIMAEALADVSRCQRGRPISQQVIQHSLRAGTKVTPRSQNNQAPFTLACLRPCVISLRVCLSYADGYIFLPTHMLFIPSLQVSHILRNTRQGATKTKMSELGLLLDACRSLCAEQESFKVTLICLERGTLLLATLALTASFPVRVLSPPN